MPITVKEYHKRVAFVRQLMKEEGLDALVIYSWKRGQVTYLSGYWPGYVANMAMVILPQEGEPSLLIRLAFDLERAKRMSWINDIRTVGTLSNFPVYCGKILRKGGIRTGKVGFVAGDATVDEMPYSILTAMKKDLTQIEFVSASALLEKARLVKSREEISILKKSASIARRSTHTKILQ